MGIVYKILRTGIPVNRGFSDLVNIRLDETSATVITGFCIDVFSSAIEALQYKVPYVFIPFLGPNGHSLGSQNDLIDQVYFRVSMFLIVENYSLYNFCTRTCYIQHFYDRRFDFFYETAI